MYFKYRIMSDHSKREYRNIGKHLFFYHTLSSYPFLVVSRTRNLFRRVIKFSPTMKHARAHTHGHGVVARKVITFRSTEGKTPEFRVSKSPKERRRTTCIRQRGRNERASEQASSAHARVRACSYVYSLARIILVDGAPAGSINSSALLYPVEGEITLEIITG